MYGISDPYGLIYQGGIYETAREAWCAAFEIISAQQGAEWRTKYWKRYEPFVAWARRRRWDVVPAKVTTI